MQSARELKVGSLGSVLELVSLAVTAGRVRAAEGEILLTAQISRIRAFTLTAATQNQ